MVDSGRIRELALALEQMQERASEAREDVKAATEAAKDAGLDPAAMKLCLRLKAGKSVKTNAFLNTFDLCRDALGLDGQLDIEDAIAADEQQAA